MFKLIPEYAKNADPNHVLFIRKDPVGSAALSSRRLNPFKKNKENARASIQAVLCSIDEKGSYVSDETRKSLLDAADKGKPLTVRDWSKLAEKEIGRERVAETIHQLGFSYDLHSTAAVRKFIDKVFHFYEAVKISQSDWNLINENCFGMGDIRFRVIYKHGQCSFDPDSDKTYIVEEIQTEEIKCAQEGRDRLIKRIRAENINGDGSQADEGVFEGELIKGAEVAFEETVVQITKNRIKEFLKDPDKMKVLEKYIYFLKQANFSVDQAIGAIRSWINIPKKEELAKIMDAYDAGEVITSEQADLFAQFCSGRST